MEYPQPEGKTNVVTQKLLYCPCGRLFTNFYHQDPMILGLLLVVVGIVFLLQNLGFISATAWSVIWPLCLVVFGLKMMFRRHNHGWCVHDWHHGKKCCTDEHDVVNASNDEKSQKN